MISKYYMNGEEVDADHFYHTASYYDDKKEKVNGIHEHHWKDGKVDTYIYVNGEYLGSVQDVKKNKLSFLVRFGISFEQWCKKNGYKSKGGK